MYDTSRFYQAFISPVMSFFCHQNKMVTTYNVKSESADAINPHLDVHVTIKGLFHAFFFLTNKPGFRRIPKRPYDDVPKLFLSLLKSN